MARNGKLYFQETQVWRRHWVWLTRLFLFIPLMIGLVLTLYFRDWSPVLIMAACFLIPMGFTMGLSKLITEVRDDGIYFRFYPIHLRFKRIPFDRIVAFEAKTISISTWDVVFHGIHYWDNGWLYNVSGSDTLRLDLVGGKQIYLGSQRVQEFAQAVTQAMAERSFGDSSP